MPLLRMPETLAEELYVKSCFFWARDYILEPGEGMHVGWTEGGIPLVSQERQVQTHYCLMRLRGESHNIAKICATQQVPYSVTDREFNMGRHNNNQFVNCPWLGNYYKRQAEKAGVGINGKYYVTGLGRYPGDPKAWCRSRHDAVAIAKERNLVLDGMGIHYKGHPEEPKPDVALDPNLVNQYAQDYMEANPDMRLDDAKEKAFNRYSGRDEVVKFEPTLGDPPWTEEA